MFLEGSYVWERGRPKGSLAFGGFDGEARQGKARQGKARQGKARQGKARQGKARQGKQASKQQMTQENDGIMEQRSRKCAEKQGARSGTA